MSDTNPPGVGRAVDPDEQGCGYTGRTEDAQPPCGAAVVAHLLVLSAEYGTVSLRACDKHAGIAQRSGEVLADHVHVAGCDDPVTEEHWQPQPDPTSPLDLDAIRQNVEEVEQRWTDPEEDMYGLLSAAGRLIEDVKSLLAALAEAQSTVADLLRKNDFWHRKCEEATVRNGQLVADLAEVQRERDEARQERDKLTATIKAYLGTDERAVHDAANLAHARDQRDEAHRLLAALRVDAARLRPVVEAARTWYAACDPGAISAPDVRRPAVALGHAVAAYESQIGGTE